MTNWRDRPNAQQIRACKRNLDSDRSQLDAALAVLLAAKSLEHSGTTLWSHLIGTYEILTAWGASRDACLAGALHSIYATQYFASPIASEGRRGDIARTVGRRAEHLAHAFCTVDRQSIRTAAASIASRSGSVRVTHHAVPGGMRLAAATVRDLRLIDLANEVEQRQRLYVGPEPCLAALVRAFCEIGFAPSAFPPTALAIGASEESLLLRSYAQGLAASEGRAPKLFARCVAAVPYCAEPRLLLAASHLENGRHGAAYSDSSTALAHLRGWASAWDPRVSLLAWELLALQLMEAARRGDRKPPPIVAQVKARLRSELSH